MTLPRNDPVAVAATNAVQSGDVAALERLLTEHPDLAVTYLEGRRQAARTLLHVTTDWPGYFPHGPQVASLLIGAGANVDARIVGGRFAETPLHSAASSDDVHVADVLIAAGADLGAPDGCIGTPLDNAVAFGCWQVAARLVAAGAPVERLWHAAALGDLPRIDELLASNPVPSAEDLGEAFWQACHGGQRRAAERLLDAGADLTYSPDYADQATPLEAVGLPPTQRENLTEWLRSKAVPPTS